MYVILMEIDTNYKYPYSSKAFYGRVNGNCCTVDKADKFDSFIDAQPTVQKLRKEIPNHLFIGAILSIPNRGAKC